MEIDWRPHDVAPDSNNRPFLVKNHSATLVDDKIVVFGGYDGKRNLHRVMVYCTRNRSWNEVYASGPRPPARNGHTATLVGRDIFILGGWPGEGPLAADDLSALHISESWSLSWWKPTTTGPMPGECNMHTADYVPHAGKIFVFRGGDGREYLNTLHTLTVETLQWEKPDVKGKPPAPRAYHASAVLGRHLYIFGGWNGQQRLNDIHILNTDTVTWTEIKVEDFTPSPRVGMTMVPFPGHNALIMYGGLGENSGFQDLCVFDTEKHTWKSYTPVGNANGGVYQPVLDSLCTPFELAAAVFSSDTGLLSPDQCNADSSPVEDGKSEDNASTSSPGPGLQAPSEYEGRQSEHNPQSIPVQLAADGSSADAVMLDTTSTREHRAATPAAPSSKFTLSRVYGSPSSLLSTPPLVTVVGDRPRVSEDSGGGVTRGLHFPDAGEDGTDSPMHRLMAGDGGHHDGGHEDGGGTPSHAEGLQGGANMMESAYTAAVSSPPASARTRSTPMKTPSGSQPPVYHDPNEVYVRGTLVAARSGHSMCADGNGSVFIVGGAIGRRYAGYVLEMDAAPWRRAVVPPHLFVARGSGQGAGSLPPTGTLRHSDSTGKCTTPRSHGAPHGGATERKSSDDIDMEVAGTAAEESLASDAEEWEAACTGPRPGPVRYPLFTPDTLFSDLTLVAHPHEFHVHRIVLSRSSSVLHAMLGAFGFAESASRVLHVQGVPPLVFFAFLTFLYTQRRAAVAFPAAAALFRAGGGKIGSNAGGGAISQAPTAGEVDAALPQAPYTFPMASQAEFEYYTRLLQLAHRYMIDDLQQVCEEHLCAAISLNTVAFLHRLAEHFQGNTLTQACLRFMRRYNLAFGSDA